MRPLMNSHRRTFEARIALPIALALPVLLASCRRAPDACQNHEVLGYLASIAAAQDLYHSDHGQYCSVAADPTNPKESDYDPPLEQIRGAVARWDAPNPRWADCFVSPPSHTRAQYLVVAGEAGTPCVNPPDFSIEEGVSVSVTACDYVDTEQHWYYVVARADYDGDGSISVCGTTNSMTDDLLWSLDH